VALFFGYPLAYNLVLSVRDYSTSSFYSGVAPFNGSANYDAVFGSPLFGTTLRNTAIFTLGSIFFQFVIGLALAVFFQRGMRLGTTLRSLILLPWLLPVVVSGAVWRWMFDQEHGVLNAFLQTLHLTSGDTPWLNDPHWAMASLIITNVWIGIPFNMVILHAGLQAIPRTYYEAAALDGATSMQRFRYITWPLLKPVTAIVLTLCLVYTIKLFDVVQVLTGGGPGEATQTLTTWAYQLSFQDFAFGQGAAVGNILIAMATVFGLVYLGAARRELREAAR